MRAQKHVVIVILSLWSLSLALFVARTRAQGVEDDVDDLAFITDDDAANDLGCDSIVAVNVRTGSSVTEGRRFVSPGRLTVSSDARWVLSQSNNNDQFIAVARRELDRPSRWMFSKIGRPIAQGGPIAVSPDDLSVVLSYPDRIARHALAKMRLTDLGPEQASYRVNDAAVLIFTSDAKRLVVVRVDGLIDVVDAQSLRPIQASIHYVPINAPPWRRLRQTYATITRDDRYLLVNSGTEEVNVVDINLGQSWTITVPEVKRTYGIVVDYASRRDVFAVHALDKLAVYDLVDGRHVKLLGEIGVPVQVPERSAPVPGNERYYRRGAVAWTSRGDGLIAAIGGALEFRVVDAIWSADGVTLKTRFDVDGCTSDNHLEAALDVVTLNGNHRVPIPTASPLASLVPPTSSQTVEPATWTPVAPSDTPSPSGTPISSPSPSATTAPRDLYLPLALRERCTPTQRPADVVVAIDASTSMLDRDASGAVKLDAAVAAARMFLGLLDLAGGAAGRPGDRAAVLAFSADAVLLQSLTADRAALDGALARIAPAAQTCLACAVEAADAELASPRRRAGTAAVVVLLTDGRANPRPAGEAVAAAEAAKRRGVTFFTIALGDDVDADALAAIAAPGGRFERTADAAGLEAIYRQIAIDLPCPGAAFWGRR